MSTEAVARVPELTGVLPSFAETKGGKKACFVPPDLVGVALLLSCEFLAIPAAGL